VFSGSTGSVLLTLVGDSAGDTFGFAVAGSGDLNGDSVPDVLVGTRKEYAKTFSGVDGSVLHSFGIGSVDDRFGANVAGAGDVNGDGVPDIVIGAIEADPGGLTDAGQAYVFSVTAGVLTVSMDIKPGSFPNSVSLGAKGLIPVAILTTATFDAALVSALSVVFGPGRATEAHGKGHMEDVDGDGDLDMVLHFRTQQVGLCAGDTAACLQGQTVGGQTIEGCDSVNIVGQ
jgi:hypothetical protein